VVNKIGFADPHTEHSQYKILVMLEMANMENVNKEFKLKLIFSFMNIQVQCLSLKKGISYPQTCSMAHKNIFQ
jgi:hypothetical protein